MYFIRSCDVGLGTRLIDTGPAAVSLISKGVWTQLVKRDSALVLDQWSGKELVRVNGASLSICGSGNTDFVEGYSIYGHLHCN